MITWSRLARMKLCPVLLGSCLCYIPCINYILQLHIKCFILTRWDPSFVQPGSCFAGMKFSHVITSARLGRIKELIKKYPWKYISIDWRYLYCVFTTHMTLSVRKNFYKHLCRISLFYRSSYWRCSAKKLFLKILQYSQENTYVGVSSRTFKSAILSKRDSKANVFLWILRNF